MHARRPHGTGSLKLVETDENAPKPLTGAQVFREVADLIADRLRSIPFEDPDRGVLAALVHSAPPPTPRGAA